MQRSRKIPGRKIFCKISMSVAFFVCYTDDSEAELSTYVHKDARQKEKEREAPEAFSRSWPSMLWLITDDELDHILRFQTETSNNVSTAAPEKRGGRRYLPYVYSEHGVIVLA
jgi:hypothetical protein